MKYYIKNMVCLRCIKAVEGILKKLDASIADIRLGEVLLTQPLSPGATEQFRYQLSQAGFELLDDSRSQLIVKIKSIIVDHIHYLDDEKFSFSKVLPRELNKEYSQLSKLFSETEGVTIEHYVIQQKIEKAKELLAYKQMNLNEISYKLGYSSVAHLSAQFKKVTGLTPSQFKTQGIHLRKSLDHI
ncbi:AraC family transcriptional regulator [Mucilaginibacter sp.]|uniref:AraC family transcriptional regulator n=1 Tax=Mucilaginibacter sp. TaxID=1882438 RepID=UPI002D7EA3EE|nr:AraC family transcriptional regulator [Mucilaginibacter sp.]